MEWKILSIVCETFDRQISWSHHLSMFMSQSQFTSAWSTPFIFIVWWIKKATEIHVSPCFAIHTKIFFSFLRPNVLSVAPSLRIAHTATEIPPKKKLCFIFITRYFFDREQFGSVGVSVANWTDVGRKLMSSGKIFSVD